MKNKLFNVLIAFVVFVAGGVAQNIIINTLANNTPGWVYSINGTNNTADANGNIDINAVNGKSVGSNVPNTANFQQYGQNTSSITNANALLGNGNLDTDAQTVVGAINELNTKINAIATVDEVYPVGSIYIATNDVSPATIFGGTWEKIEGRTLVGADSTYSLGSTGGNDTYTLTNNNLPTNMGSFQVGTWSDRSTNTSGIISRTSTLAGFNRDMYGGGAFGAMQYSFSGGGQAFSLMQPYIAVNIWKRTA